MDIKEETPKELFQQYRRLTKLSENNNNRMDDLFQYRSGFVTLNNNILRNNPKKLSLLANSIILCTVDINKYPEALVDDKFYPFRYSSCSIPFHKLPLEFTQLEIEYNNELRNIPLSFDNRKTNENSVDILFSNWNGTPTLIRVAHGAIGFPVI